MIVTGSLSACGSSIDYNGEQVYQMNPNKHSLRKATGTDITEQLLIFRGKHCKTSDDVCLATFPETNAQDKQKLFVIRFNPIVGLAGFPAPNLTQGEKPKVVDITRFGFQLWAPDTDTARDIGTTVVVWDRPGPVGEFGAVLVEQTLQYGNEPIKLNVIRTDRNDHVWMLEIPDDMKQEEKIRLIRLLKEASPRCTGNGSTVGCLATLPPPSELKAMLNPHGDKVSNIVLLTPTEQLQAQGGTSKTIPVFVKGKDGKVKLYWLSYSGKNIHVLPNELNTD